MRSTPLLASVFSIAAISLSAPPARAEAPRIPSGEPSRVARKEGPVSPRAMRIHRQAIVLDTHIDVPLRMARPGWDITARHAAPSPEKNDADASHVDLPRMREGGLDGLFFSIFTSGKTTGAEAVRKALEIIDIVRSAVEKHPDKLMFATTAADIRRAHKEGKVAALLGMEGGHMIANSLAVLRDYHRLGVRYLTLTHSVNTDWADSSGDKPAHDGLTDFGKDVVREMNRLGMMVDISHVSDKTFEDALAASRAPLIASHSSCRALSSHPRNMSDDMIRALAARGGLIQINFGEVFLDEDYYQKMKPHRPRLDALMDELMKKYPKDEDRVWNEYRAEVRKLGVPRPSWRKIVQHIDHVAKLVGPAHVGLGSDFDGAGMPEGMDDVTALPRITEALLQLGYSEKDITNILGGNLLRVMEEVERTSAKMR